MCLNETNGKVRIGTGLSNNTFPIRNGLKQGDSLSPLLFSFPLEYAIRKNWNLMDTSRHRLCWWCSYTRRKYEYHKDTETLVQASREVGVKSPRCRTKLQFSVS